MGVDKTAVELTIDLYNKGHFNGFKSVIELGSQDLHFGNRNILRDLLIKNLPMPAENIRKAYNDSLITATQDDYSTEWLYKLLGFTEYSAIDGDGKFNAHVWDLNFPVPRKHWGKYDLVTNHGTTEHVFNVLQVNKSIHDLTKPGGVMIHILPFQGNIDHGFYNYQPTFFKDIAYENDYEIIRCDATLFKIGDKTGRFSKIIPYDREKFTKLYRTLTNYEVNLHVAMRKRTASEFKIPFHGIYSPALFMSYRQSISSKLSQKLIRFLFSGKQSLGRRLQARFFKKSESN
jgi:SAM-dependent methyltransferase